MLRLLVQGWRFYPHSYALVNQFQCLELLKRKEIELYFEDVPFVSSAKPMRGIFPPMEEKQLADLRSPSSNDRFDIVYRIGYPFDLSNTSAKTLVFGTTESGAAEPDCTRGGSFRQAIGSFSGTLIAPSNWARMGFINSGAKPTQVKIIPHGVNTTIFCPPSAEKRKELRRIANVEDNFIFLHVSGLGPNKNIPMLLKAFAQIAREFPHARLALKGLDAIYTSRDQLIKAINQLSHADRDALCNKMLHFGGLFSLSMMAETYQTADAYVSCYSAEGFNLPVLEAIAIGLPVLCTAGGPTDDFTSPDFALRISAHPQPVKVGNDTGQNLSVQFDDLVAKMRQVIEDEPFRMRAKSTGPQFVQTHGYTWPAVINQLISLFKPK